LKKGGFLIGKGDEFDGTARLRLLQHASHLQNSGNGTGIVIRPRIKVGIIMSSHHEYLIGPSLSSLGNNDIAALSPFEAELFFAHHFRITTSHPKTVSHTRQIEKT